MGTEEEEDKTDVILECERQMRVLSEEEWKQFITEIQNKFQRTVKAIISRELHKKEANFLLSKMYIVGRSLVAGYYGILTPASFFVGKNLREFYSKFECIFNR